MGLHVQLLLGLVEGIDALFEESVLDAIILLLGVGNFLGGLVVAELAGFGQYGDISDGVNLLKAHLELIQEAEGNTALSLHDLVHHLRVEFDVQVS